jgi:RimJ/RimL family protein N-acetyltransferase
MRDDSDIILDTNRLLLREWNAERGELLDRYCNTDEVLKHLGFRKPQKEHRKLVRWLTKDQQDWFGITFWALERRDDGAEFSGEFLGFCGLVRADEPESTVLGCIEIGWRLRADAHRRGFAMEAATACLNYAFDELRALRVVSRTTVENEASWRLMKKLKMRHDPRLDYVSSDGEAMIVHVLTYEDWKAVGSKLPRVGFRVRKKIDLKG